MATKSRSLSSSLLLLLPFVLLSSPATAHNITKILGQFDGFSDLNRLLTQTQLAGEINSKETLTVLAVNNAVLSSISSQTPDMVKKILMLHVVLDYYDKDKLQQLPHRSAILTTLFQTTGRATGAQGFLNATVTASGRVAFRSAVPGSPVGADLVKVVAAQPSNISVLQISNVIVPPGLIGAPTPSPTPAAAPMPAPAKPPATAVSPSPRISAPPQASAPAPVAGGPVPPPRPKVPVVSPPAPMIAVPPPSDGANAPSPEAGTNPDSAANHVTASAATGFLIWAIFLGAI